MKQKLTVLVVFTITTVLFAGFIVPYDNSKPPTFSLPVAYERAVIALGSETNQFHCVNASVKTYSSPEGEWVFTFYSTNSRPKFVTVEFNGKIQVENIMAH
jgi:hypothetical protein